MPLGSNRPRGINVSFIAATHKNLNEMVLNGVFREDLLQRLNTFVLRIPPLRERPEDIIFYANLYLEECGDEGIRYTISNDGAQELLSYSWPGNIRELKSVVQRFIVLSNKTILNAEAVKTAIGMGNSEIRKELVEGNTKKDQLINAIVACNGNKKQAAVKLGINERTIHRQANKFNIHQILSSLGMN
jgi:two-component system response regulator HydG